MPAVVSCLTAGDLVPAGKTGRIGGMYVTAPPAMDIRFISAGTGERSSVLMFMDSTGQSGLLINGLNEDSRFVAPGPNAGVVTKAFDQIIVALRRAPPSPIAACFP